MSEKHPTIYYIDCILLIILLVGVVALQIQGKYIDKEVITVETCYGEPTSNGLKTLEELGWKAVKTTDSQQPNNSTNK